MLHHAVRSVMYIFCNESQFSNADSPIEVTLSGITTEVNELQFLNASSPIEVTLSGISIDVSDLQP